MKSISMEFEVKTLFAIKEKKKFNYWKVFNNLQYITSAHDYEFENI